MSPAQIVVGRAQALAYRYHSQQLDRAPHPQRAPDDAAVLDLGVQDTGADGAAWALTLRGLPVGAGSWPPELALTWTLRGAPHAYRRRDLAQIEVAVRPFSAADAAARLMSAARPLRAAGVPVLDALAEVARTMHHLIDRPTVKGTVSAQLTASMGPAYLRACVPCAATHMYEQTFRLAALHGGIELAPGTSPPVLCPIPGWPADQVGVPTPAPHEAPFDQVATALRLLGPSDPALVATFLDTVQTQVRDRWPRAARPVSIDHGPVRWVGDPDQLDALLAATPPDPEAVRLLAPFDLWLQARDRDLIVPDPARHDELWRRLGRPGAVLAGTAIIGTWRPRTRGRRLALELDEWMPWSSSVRTAVAVEHARLAAFRGQDPA